jgi:hypothetical protein
VLVAYLFLGAFALLTLIVVVNWAANADAVTLRKIARYMGAILVLALAVLVGARGLFGLAGPLLVAAFIIATGVRLPMFGGGARSRGQTSSVETSHLHVTLDHDSGEMAGTVQVGEFSGRALADMSRDELSALYDELERDDPDGARLLDAYLGRRFKGEWQEQASTSGSASSAASGPMNREEALDVLGLEDGASEAQVKSAHRRLMKKFHPDHGGSTYFAARINQAKDLLLG